MKKNKPKTSKLSYCRLCAELKSKKDLIKESVQSSSDLFDKLLLCFQIKINVDNKLPKSICIKCSERVLSSYEFKEEVYAAQENLEKLFLEDDSSIKTENGTDRGDADYIKDETKADSEADAPSTAKLANLVLVKEENDNFDPNQDFYDSASVNSEKYGNDDNWSEDDDFPLILQKPKAESLSDYRGRSDRQEFLDFWKNYNWKCHVCACIVGTLKDLHHHYSYTHNDPIKYSCIECSQAFDRLKSFRRHVYRHRNKIKYRCEFCGKCYAKKKQFERHLETHSDDRNYKCSDCDKTFKSAFSLYGHRKTHLAGDKNEYFVCDVCNKVFKTKFNLSSHKKIHLGIKEHVCEQCGQGFTQKGNLDQHIKSKHTSETPFKCEQCFRAFKTGYQLKRHKVIHSDDKPFACEVCGKFFREKSLLRAHLAVHSEDLPFECEYCKKRFKRKSFLRIHLRQHTGERPYSCQECVHFFTNWTNYNKHMLGRHGIDIKLRNAEIKQKLLLEEKANQL